MQFPPRFQRDKTGIGYLRLLPVLLPDLPVVIEFRHQSWVDGPAQDETVDLLRELGLGLCCVDEPQLRGNMPPVTAVTSSVGYVRFHGRNYADWWPAISQPPPPHSFGERFAASPARTGSAAPARTN